MNLNFKPATFLIFILLFVLIQNGLAFAQTDNADISAKDIQINENESGSDTVDKEVAKKLNEMTPEEINVLDKKLANALVLYYERDFARALPIFMEVASKAETMDIMFWIGTSAMRSGESELAVKKFKQMLSINPKLNKVRLELAATYFNMGSFEEARRELEIVKATSPPKAVLDKISKMLSAIDQKSKKMSWNLRIAEGIVWDDNINSGPDLDTYQVPGGVVIPLKPNYKLKDEAMVTTVAGNLLIDTGEAKGFMWNTSLSFYNKAHFDYSQFDFLSIDINTGPWWVGQRDILKLPIGYTEREYGSDRLSYAFHIDPEFEHHFNQYFSIKGLFSYTTENFYYTSRSGLDNERYRFGISPSFYLDNRKHVFSLTTGYDYMDCDDDRYTFDGPYLGLSYLTKFPTNTELFVQYLWTKKDFDEKPFPYFKGREDKRDGITAIVSQGFLKYFYTSFAYTYADNNSNADLYDYDRNTYTLSLGCRF
jgi:tetratricopeptide (TPR) repeat protein